MPMPAEYLRNVGEQRILERVYIYEQIYKLYVEPSWFANHLSLEITRHCVDNYFIDVERIKDFHGSKRINRHRQAAYTMKWIAKLRPVQLTVGHSITEASMFINEIFAIQLGFHYFKKPLNKLDPTILYDLLYDLHFRSFDGEVLTLAMRAIDASL